MADEVEALLAVRQDPNETAWVGSTALVAAAGSGRMQIISALIDAGADRNQTDHNGRSPLWLEVSLKYLSISVPYNPNNLSLKYCFISVIYSRNTRLKLDFLPGVQGT